MTAALLCAVFPACGSDKKSGKGEDGGATAKAAIAGEKSDENVADEGGEKNGGKAGVDAEDPAANIAPVVDVPDGDPTEHATIAYAVQMKTLLDLLPEGSEQFVLIRDITAGVDVYDTLVGSHVESIKPLLGSPDAVAKLDLASAGLTALRAELAKNVMDTSKGAIFSVQDEALIYAAEDPNAFRNLLTAMGASDTQMPKHCVAPAGLPGYAACGDDKGKLAKLTAGNKGGDRIAALTAALPGVDLERANIAGTANDNGGQATFAMTMAAGSLHMAVSMNEATAELSKYVKAGPAPTMALHDPTTAFVWASLETGDIQRQLSAQVPMFGGIGASLTGEVFFGGVADSSGVAALVGVSDASPAAGLIALASSQLQMVPKSLADGTTIDVKMESIDADELEVNTVHAVFGGDGQIKKLSDLGMAPEAYAFAAGNYMAVTLGAKGDAVEKIATHTNDPVTKAQLAGLPGSLATAMAAGEVGFAVHLPMDGVQAPAVRGYFLTSMQQMPPQQLGGLDPEQISKSMVSAVAPFSSLSIWLTHPKKERVIHAVVQGFGDVATAEGKAANEAVAAVAGGADPKTTYAELAAKYPSSPTAGRYATRAGSGTSGASAMSSAFVLGLMAGVTVPALQNAAGGAPPPRAVPVPPSAPTPPSAPVAPPTGAKK